MKHELPAFSFLSGLILGLLPILFLKKILVSIDVSLFLAFPPLAYAIGALPRVLSVRDVQKECPYCQKKDTKKLVSFTVNHIRTIGADGVHAWGTRAKILSAIFWGEVGLFIGLALFFAIERRGL